MQYPGCDYRFSFRDNGNAEQLSAFLKACYVSLERENASERDQMNINLTDVK